MGISRPECVLSRGSIVAGELEKDLESYGWDAVWPHSLVGR